MTTYPATELPAEAAEQEAVRRSVDAQFPLVAQLLADRPSGAPLALLPAMPAQPSRVEPVEAPEAPRTWTFTSSETSRPVTVTCMPGCEMSHSSDIKTPTHPEDIWCQARAEDVTLPVNVSTEAEEFRILGITLNVRPFDKRMSQRLPHVDVEVLDDHWVECLDPDGLEDVIDALAARVASLRKTHAQLIEVRAAYRKQA
ncbi:DUF6907 domain-containing protein [Streptomyces xanthochromogenes]|uniref:DUF6907 domain-containing protein n=1 Tax=Streptomyces xanthochromogenes TaxID=67384 RepID=UPI0038270F21